MGSNPDSTCEIVSPEMETVTPNWASQDPEEKQVVIADGLQPEREEKQAIGPEDDGLHPYYKPEPVPVSPTRSRRRVWRIAGVTVLLVIVIAVAVSVGVVVSKNKR